MVAGLLGCYSRNQSDAGIQIPYKNDIIILKNLSEIPNRGQCGFDSGLNWIFRETINSGTFHEIIWTVISLPKTSSSACMGKNIGYLS